MYILVINSNLSERTLIQQVVEQSGHQSTFVETVEDALQITKERVFRFIIADAVEQEHNIQEFTKLLRRAPSSAGHTYLLLLAAEGQNESLLANLGSNADDYLCKPINLHDLRARVAVGIRILSLGDTLTQVNKKLENLAMYDNLTGLMNRQAFYNISQGELERARRTSEGISVIALDVDNFRDINREYGHSVGDDVLKVITQIIREKSRPYDCLGRWSGDQFLLTLPGIVSSDAEKIAMRILNGIRASGLTLSDGQEVKVKLSAGIASAQNINAYAEVDNYIQNAIQALNNSKQSDTDEVCMVYI